MYLRFDVNVLRYDFTIVIYQVMLLFELLRRMSGWLSAFFFKPTMIHELLMSRLCETKFK